MKASGRILTLLAVLVIGYSATEPAVVRATEAPFPNSFTDATDWTEFGIGSLPGAPDRFASLDALTRQLEGFLTAGIRTTRPGAGVAITVPDGAARALEIHAFVTIVGGASDASAGTQM